MLCTAQQTNRVRIGMKLLLLLYAIYGYSSTSEVTSQLEQPKGLAITLTQETWESSL